MPTLNIKKKLFYRLVDEIFSYELPVEQLVNLELPYWYFNFFKVDHSFDDQEIKIAKSNITFKWTSFFNKNVVHTSSSFPNSIWRWFLLLRWLHFVSRNFSLSFLILLPSISVTSVECVYIGFLTRSISNQSLLLVECYQA